MGRLEVVLKCDARWAPSAPVGQATGSVTARNRNMP
ncbi:hypothetical protein GGR03_003296 [Aurantimonas endophytica]|uniref:Uncharacterized protein n=1 Tax=Aurantimonas endophytica TaxID=1522175 RepID=A0A7W6HFG7_9HYPH|nr:hypothetical protein [Aurantimonas endophytica]